MQHANFKFSGIALDAFLVDDQIYITASSIAKGLNKEPQVANNWLRRGDKANFAIDVQVKTGNGATRKAKAYPIELMEEMVEYWANKGDAYAKALILSTWRADLQRSTREAFGIEVTAEQHEENRTKIRLDILDAYIGRHRPGSRLHTYADRYSQMTVVNNSLIPLRDVEHIRSDEKFEALGLTGDEEGNSVEYQVACKLAYIRDKQKRIQECIEDGHGYANYVKAINCGVEGIQKLLPDYSHEEIMEMVDHHSLAVA